MKTQTFQIDGMTCGGCVSAVTNALKAVDGVRDVAVSLTPGQARVEFDESAATPERLRAAIEHAGFEVGTQNAAQPGTGGCCCG
jgi:copper ion binding protein